MTSPGNQAQFSWQAAAAGLLLGMAAALGAVFSQFSVVGWAAASLAALPFALAHGALLPRLAERLRPPPSAASGALD